MSILGGIKTKKGKLAYTKNVVYGNGCGYITKEHEHFPFFTQLIEYKKYPLEISYFSIVPNRINRASLETQVHFIDGSISVFSWNKSATGGIISDSERLTNLMRKTIVPDILEFKRGAVCCVTCGETEYLQADHIEPFRDLARDYKNRNGDYNGSCEWLENWGRYHKTRARLQILCAGCNYAKH